MILIVFTVLAIFFLLLIVLFIKSSVEQEKISKREKLSKEGLKEIQKHRKG